MEGLERLEPSASAERCDQSATSAVPSLLLLHGRPLLGDWTPSRDEGRLVSIRGCDSGH